MPEQGRQHVAVACAENAAFAEGFAGSEGNLHLPAAHIVDIDAHILLRRCRQQLAKADHALNIARGDEVAIAEIERMGIEVMLDHIHGQVGGRDHGFGQGSGVALGHDLCHTA